MPAEGLRIAQLLAAAGLAPSNSEANRKLKERAVRVDGEVIEDAARVFAPGFRGRAGDRQAQLRAGEADHRIVRPAAAVSGE